MQPAVHQREINSYLATAQAEFFDQNRVSFRGVPSQ
jgi:hypothetical protein